MARFSRNQAFELEMEWKFFRAYPSLKPHILFYSNGLAIWHGLPDIRHIKINYGQWSDI